MVWALPTRRAFRFDLQIKWHLDECLFSAEFGSSNKFASISVGNGNLIMSSMAIRTRIELARELARLRH